MVVEPNPHTDELKNMLLGFFFHVAGPASIAFPPQKIFCDAVGELGAGFSSVKASAGSVESRTCHLCHWPKGD